MSMIIALSHFILFVMLILSALVRKYAEGDFYRINFPKKQAKMEESESESEETKESEDSESSEESDSSDLQRNNLKVTGS